MGVMQLTGKNFKKKNITAQRGVSDGSWLKNVLIFVRVTIVTKPKAGLEQ